jgi:cytochrome b
MHLTCLGLINPFFFFVCGIVAFIHHYLRLIHGCLTKSSGRLRQISEESSMIARYLRLKTKEPYRLL